MPIRCLKAAFLAVAVLVLSGVPASAATLSFEHVSTQVTDTSPMPDGIISPGDTFTVRERVLNNTLTSLSSLSGTLTATGGVSILQGASPLDVVAFGQETFNSTLFQAHVPTGTECGANLDFSLGLSSGADATSVPFTVGTGVAGSLRAYDSADAPRPIPDGGKVASSLFVADAGRVKDLRVRIGRITHPYDSDLTVTLIAPDGTRVELIRGVGASGDNFVDTVLSTQGVPLSGSAPFTGTWRVDALRGLAGHAMQGTWKLEVSDATNADAGTLDAWGLDLTPATCAPQPIASFSVSPVSPAPGVSVTFDATGSTDPVGTIVRYEWDLDGDGTYEVDGGTSPTTSTTYATRGARTVALRITDDHGLADITTRSVSVSQAPIASFLATPAAPASGQTTTLDAGASHDQDVGGTIVRYEWDLDGNGSFEADGGAGATIETAFAHFGPAIVRLRVTDDDGAQATAMQTITVANRAPTAALTAPAPVILGASTTLDASGSTDPDGAIVSYGWDFDDDGTVDQTTATPTVGHVFAATGPVTVRVTVTDDATPGATATTTRALVVTRLPVAALSAAPNPARPGQTVTLDASASTDPDGAPLAKVEWDLDGVSGYERDTGTTKTTTKSWTQTGTYTVRVRVTDADGATDVKSVDVSVANAAPTALLYVGPNPALTDQAVLFDASASGDSDGTVVKYEWDLDGNGVYELDTGSSPTITRTYPNVTMLAVGVRVTDNDGATSTKVMSLSVSTPQIEAPAGGGDTSMPSTTTAPVTTSPGGTTAAKPGTTAKPGTDPSDPDSAALDRASLAASLTGAAIQPIATALKRGVRIACQADRPAKCAVTAVVQPAEAKRLKLVRAARGKGAAPKSYKVGSATANAARAKDGSIVIRLPAKLRKALRRARSVLIIVRGTAVDASGKKVELARAVLLRR